MRFRKLRIAFSATCLIACVLLLVLWVRSGNREDRISGLLSNSQGFRIYSSHGCLVLYTAKDPGAEELFPWRLTVGSQHWLQQSDDRIALFPHFDRGYNSTSINIPYWLLVLVAIVFAALPWIPLRFSLRTLLIATTLIAVVLGLAVWAAR